MKLFNLEKLKMETKNLARGEVYGVDRGGVEPLEQGGNPAPGNRPDPALVHKSYHTKNYPKVKSPLAGAL